MEFEVRIKKDGTRTHEVLQREAGENCQMIRQFDGGGVVLSDEQTGPDCDEVHETQV